MSEDPKLSLPTGEIAGRPPSSDWLFRFLDALRKNVGMADKASMDMLQSVIQDVRDTERKLDIMIDQSTERDMVERYDEDGRPYLVRQVGPETHPFKFKLFDDVTGDLLHEEYDSFKNFVYLAHTASKKTGHTIRIETLDNRLLPTRIKAELIHGS